jgi:hypothetical protein
MDYIGDYSGSSLEAEKPIVKTKYVIRAAECDQYFSGFDKQGYSQWDGYVVDGVNEDTYGIIWFHSIKEAKRIARACKTECEAGVFEIIKVTEKVQISLERQLVDKV